MELNLKNPLIIFDLETTGVDVSRDRIIELSYIKVYPNHKEETRTYRINPEMHIPETSTAVHGITDEDVKDCPTFKMVAKELERVFEGCDIAGFNSNHFDVPMLVQEFLSCGIDIDLSLVVGNEQTYSALSEAWTDFTPLLKSVSLIDSYNGAVKSITLRFTFSSMEKTLSKNEVQSYVDTILENLGRLGVVLR